MKMLVVAMGAMFAVSACGKKEGEAAGGGGGDTGAPTCDKYLKTMEACLSKLPEAAQGPAKDAMKQTTDAWKAISDKTALEAACKSAWDAGKQAMGQMCPDVKWE
ncbi:MAG TPA: hypothetical protein PK095_11760 [Myxococcota bacterium]|nr:hypothetical protein [Myxococcota bacterium]